MVSTHAISWETQPRYPILSIISTYKQNRGLELPKRSYVSNNQSEGTKYVRQIIDSTIQHKVISKTWLHPQASLEEVLAKKIKSITNPSSRIHNDLAAS